MTWQLAALAVVCLALVVAGLWVERRRPEPRLIALVATLAALAALGRDAFAALPDVKPITAIVFVCGVGLGAGPAFSIGALAALVSNMLLGQGPWTPWQMLAWGLVGALGGLFGRIGAPAHRRLVLAGGAALSAVLFNLVMDLYTFTATGSHTLAALWVVLASAAVFDLTHVVATFAFAAAFGPTLLKILSRALARSRVRWRAPFAEPGASAAILAVLAVGALVASAAHADSSLSRSQRYLLGAQNSDGGWGAAPGESSSAIYTAWSAIGLAASGRSAAAVAKRGGTGLQALAREARGLHGTGDIERTILAAAANGANPAAFAGRDLARELERRQRANGSTEGLVNATAFAVLALRAAHIGTSAPPLRRAVAWLERRQQRGGGFSFAGAGPADVDDTAAVLQALRAGAGSRHARVAARTFIERAQNRDGGFPQQPGGPSNAQSAAWAIQGLIAAGADPARVRDGGATALGYLRSMVQPDGAVRYSRSSRMTPVWVTAQALAALAGQALPLRPVAGAATRRPAPPAGAPTGAAFKRQHASPAAAPDPQRAVELLVRATVEPVTQRISEGV